MTSTEDRLLRRARLRLTLLVWAALSAVIVIVAGAVIVYVSHEQTRDLGEALRSAVASGDPAARYSDDVYLAVSSPAGTKITAGAPVGLPVAAGVAAARAGGGRDDRVVTLEGVEVRVLTEVKGDRVVQAVVSTHAAANERDRLLAGLAVALLLGLAAAGVVGGLVARRAIAPLGLAMERQRRFVADASHELRTPLTLLSTRAQLLERDLRGSETPAAHAEAQALVADTRRMADVVEDLLVAASLQAQPARLESVDLVAMVRRSVAAMDAHARTLGVSLCGPPADATPEIVPGAERSLRRVVDALLDNALGHTPPGGHVRVGVEEGQPGWVVVSVADDGSGLDPAEAQQLFARFARGGSDPDGSRRRFGLGLALVREVVEAHRGRVEVDGAVGEGATFRVLLPRGTAA